MLITSTKSTPISDNVSNVAISMTSIPSRFDHLTECLQSWLNQDIKPSYIFLFIPKQYKRFKRKHNNNEDISFSKTLITILNSSITLKEHIDNIIHIIEVDYDWGPITKVMGMLQYNSDWYLSHSNKQPDYWIICDDDVKYLPRTINDYML